MALREWQYVRRHDGSNLHSVQHQAMGRWPDRLVMFSSAGWHSFMREGAQSYGWAERYHSIVRPRWVDVPVAFWLAPRTGNAPIRTRSQFRKAQPATKTNALSLALRQSAEAIRAKRSS